MRPLLLGLSAALAAAVAIPASAAAQSWSSHGVTVHRGSGGDRLHRDGGRDFRGDFRRERRALDCDFGRDRRGDRHDRRDRRSQVDCDVFTGGWYGGEWALYNNRSWEPDSYNDWWHDRPDRSFPRWMANNPNCERLWWSGGGWRC